MKSNGEQENVCQTEQHQEAKRAFDFILEIYQYFLVWFTFVYSGVRFLCDSEKMEMIWTEPFDISFFVFVTTKTIRKIIIGNSEKRHDFLLAAVFFTFARMFGSSSSSTRSNAHSYTFVTRTLSNTCVYVSLIEWICMSFRRRCAFWQLSKNFGPI